MKRSIWIGFDPREAPAFAVARNSIRRRLSAQIPILGLVLEDLRAHGLYTRPTSAKINSDGHKQLIDELSVTKTYDGSMATQFAVSRFLVPHLARHGWALFMDCDMLVRADLVRLFDQCDESKALMCVKHNHAPTGTVKMDGQTQTAYSRKNWSSVMVFNCDHPANKPLTPELVNSLPGRDLHRFCWLKDEDIGTLSHAWNWLAGEQPEPEAGPHIVHHTLGSPCLAGYENAPYADEWRAEFNQWAAGR